MRNNVRHPFSVQIEDARAAIRVGVSVGLPIAVLYALNYPHLAVNGAFGALTSLYGHSETADRRIETQLVVGVSLVATVAIAASYSVLHAPVGYLIFLLFAIVCAAGTLGTAMKWVPRGEIFFILVFLVIAGIPLQRDGFWPAVAASVGGAGISVLMTMLDAWSIPNPGVVARRVRARASMGSATLDRKQHAIVVGAAAIAVIAAWVCADSLHIGHPFWAPVTVAAVMPALISADVVQRTTRLLLGTLAGLGFAALLFAAEPRPLTLIAMIVACQALAELFITSSYAVALFFITPLAIGMSNLGRGLPWTPLIMERMTEAIVGSVVACATIIVGRILLAKEAPTHRTGTG
jgi:hypothetical protein